MSLHCGDIVEEVATNWRGTINYITPTYWRVYFSDGQKPPLGIFQNEAEFRLVTCPHSDSGPGFVLKRGIMGGQVGSESAPAGVPLDGESRGKFR